MITTTKIMAQQPNHQNLDLCLSEWSTSSLPEPSGLCRRVSAASTTASEGSEDEQCLNKYKEFTSLEDDQWVDLSKYGLPEALTKPYQDLPETLESVIQSSVDNMLAQVAAESELHWRLKEEDRGRSEEDSDQSKDKGRILDKGKGVDRTSAVSTAAEGYNTPSRSSSHRLVLTPPPSKATSSVPSTEKASPSAESAFEFTPEAAPTDGLTAANTRPRGNSSPTVNTSSSCPSNPKKRHLLWTVFRRLSDADPYLGLLRHHSTGELHQASDLRERLKKTKKALYRNRETGFVVPRPIGPPVFVFPLLPHLLVLTFSSVSVFLALTTSISGTSSSCAATTTASHASGVSSRTRSRPKPNGHQSAA